MKRKRTLGPWESSHPTMSFRVPPELQKRINVLRRKGKPLHEVLEKGLGLVEQHVNDYDRGFSDGMKKWKGKFYLTCQICKDPNNTMLFDIYGNPKHTAVIVAAFKDWVHTTCLNKKKKVTTTV